MAYLMEKKSFAFIIKPALSLCALLKKVQADQKIL